MHGVGRRRAAAARAPASSARWCGRAGGRSRSRRRRCRSSAATGRRSRGRRLRADLAAVGDDAKSVRVGCGVRSVVASGTTSVTRCPATSGAPTASLSRSSAVEHIARAVGVGKQLAAGFFVQADADLAEERDRVADREGAQHAADDRRLAAPEIALGDGGVRDVAARSAADEDLRARRARAVEQHDRARAVEPAREDRGGQAGGAGADDRHVARRGKLEGQGRKLTVKTRARQLGI